LVTSGWPVIRPEWSQASIERKLFRFVALLNAGTKCPRNRLKPSIFENEIALSALLVLHGCGAQIEFVLNDQQPTVRLEREDWNVRAPVFRCGSRVTRIEHVDLTILTASPKIV
jgi:hypothetical protein